MTITITSRCFSLYARTREGWLKKRPETRVGCKEALKSRTGKRIDGKRRSSVIREGWGLIPSAFGRNGALFSHSSQPSTASITLTAPWSVRAITGCSGSRTSRGNRSNRWPFPRGVTHVFGIRVLRRSVTKLRRLHKPGKPGQ